MFASIKHMYKISDKALIRTIRGRLGPSGPPSTGPNPGLDSRIRAFKRSINGTKIDVDDAEEFVEQSNSDLFSAGEAYNEHMNETLIGKYVMRHQIVKEKYFKENMPNLLTWSEKEQIRLLHSQHPDEWTPQKISESFPVTEAIVKKILKYPWKPTSESRIARHDASALRNWKELKEGTLNIPEDIRQHFLKFSNRTIPPLNKKSIKIDLTKQQEIGQFQKIIEKCAAKENLSQNNQFEQEMHDGESTDNMNNATKKYKDSQWTTLDKLTNKIKDRLGSGKKIDVPDQIILNTIAETEDSIATSSKNIESSQIESENVDEKALSHFENDNEVISATEYPERIRVPKKAFKRGATYKVNDCYYDDDGRFLYRVIGMTK